MGKIRSNRLLYVASFDPIRYTPGEYLNDVQSLVDNNALSIPLPLQFLRRKGDFAVALLPGVFSNNFAALPSNTSDDLVARSAITEKIKDLYPYRSWQPGRAVINREGQFFYHREYIKLLRQHAPTPAFFATLYSFLTAARTQPSLIQGPKTRRPVKPPAERVRVAGRLPRGHAWSANEDQVLRQWFGIRTVGDHAGHHATLTEPEWVRVLELLGDMRTRRSILQRISILNLALKREFSVDGYIPRARVREYMTRVLGERPRFPRLAPARGRARRTPGRTPASRRTTGTSARPSQPSGQVPASA